jgi:hypothetical protein
MKEIKKLLQIMEVNYIYAIFFSVINSVTIINKKLVAPQLGIATIIVVFLLNLMIYKVIVERYYEIQVGTIVFIKRYCFPTIILTSIQFLLLGITYIPLEFLFKKLGSSALAFNIIKFIFSTIYYYLMNLSIPFLLYKKTTVIDAFVNSIKTALKEANQLVIIILLLAVRSFINLSFIFDNICYSLIKEMIVNLISFLILVYGIVKVKEMMFESKELNA